MGHFFRPPQPFIGGRQPLAPRGMPPTGIRVDEPPYTFGGPYALKAEVVQIAQPNPWTYTFMGGRQPYERLELAAAQLAILVSEQVYAAPGSLSALMRIVTIWQPNPWTYTFMGGRQPFDTRKLTPPSIDEPPYTLGGPYALKAEAVQITQPNPWTYRFMGGRQPFDTRELTPPSIDEPPYTLGGPYALKAEAVQITQPNPWTYRFMGGRQPFDTREIAPGVPGVSVNPPPFTFGGPYALKAETVQIAQPNPWTYTFMGGRQPFDTRKLEPGVPGQSINDPPYTLGGPYAVNAAIVQIAQPNPWTYTFMGGLQPFDTRRLIPRGVISYDSEILCIHHEWRASKVAFEYRVFRIPGQHSSIDEPPAVILPETRTAIALFENRVYRVAGEARGAGNDPRKRTC